MNSLKKKIVALVAAAAAIFAVGMGTSSAFAEDYGTVGNPTVSGNVVTVPVTVSDELYEAGFTSVMVTVDDAIVSNVQVAGMKEFGPFPLSPTTPHTVNLKFTLKSGKFEIAVSAYNQETKQKVSIGSIPVDVTLPATGPDTTTEPKDETAKTGAAIAPYAIAVVLLAVAGIVIIAVRKRSNTR
jgi:hypothetical protein